MVCLSDHQIDTSGREAYLPFSVPRDQQIAVQMAAAATIWLCPSSTGWEYQWRESYRIILAVKEVSFESSPDDVPGHFSKFHMKEVEDSDSLQRVFHLLSSPLSMQFFKLTLHEGWDTFSSVRR